MDECSALDGVVFRSIAPDDLVELRTLHEQFFPVRYSQSFYEQACKGIGLHGLPLYSIIATKEDKIVGFLLSQFLPLSQAEDRGAIDIFSRSKTVGETEVMYILTLGCVPQLRHLGLASTMVQMCVAHCRQSPRCGAVYLHVIVSNEAAIGFYEKNRFLFYRTRYNYYEIGESSYTAYLYILTVNDFVPARSIYQKILMFTDKVIKNLLSFYTLSNQHTAVGKLRDLPNDSIISV